MNYRVLANRSANYQAHLRDDQIRDWGVLTVIRRPIVENNNDFYGDPISTYGPEEPIFVLPNYASYYQVIDILGQDVEFKLPLEVMAKVEDYVPNDSVLHLQVRNSLGSMEKRWWRVLSSDVKHLESQFSRVIRCTPVREPIDEFQRKVTISSNSGVTANAA